MKRAIERSKLDRETNIELVETMWNQFSNLGIYELNVIDTTTHSIKDTVSAVQEKIASKRTTLVEESELTHVAAPDNPTKEFENRQERFALYRAMQQLDAETREVIHLRLAGDFSFRDIGDILGHSEVWARVRFYRGRQLLSPGTKEGLPVAGKSLLVVGYSVLLCGLCGGGLRLSPCPVFPRLDTLILPLLFKVSRPVLP